MTAKTILIVDNDPDVRFVFGAILNYDGYHVFEAANGKEGVDMALRLRPDLVIMDIHMPILDGFAAAESLRADERTRDIPIVALTGEPLDDPARVERAVGLFHSRLWKPIGAAALQEHVRQIIGGP